MTDQTAPYAEQLDPTVTFIGKRTAKGLVVRRLHNGEAGAQWFVPMTGDDFRGDPLRMPFGGGPFQPCMNDGEIEQVMFFARRIFQA
jgi:hypothetical protein